MNKNEIAIRPCSTCGTETCRVAGAIMLGNGLHYCTNCKASRPRIVTPQIK